MVWFVKKMLILYWYLGIKEGEKMNHSSTWKLIGQAEVLSVCITCFFCDHLTSQQSWGYVGRLEKMGNGGKLEYNIEQRILEEQK